MHSVFSAASRERKRPLLTCAAGRGAKRASGWGEGVVATVVIWRAGDQNEAGSVSETGAMREGLNSWLRSARARS